NSGNGVDTVNITGGAHVILGNLNMNLGGGSDSVTILGGGDGVGSRVAGNIYGSGVNSFELGDTSSVGGRVYLSANVAGTNTYFFDGVMGGPTSVVGGNVIIITSLAPVLGPHTSIVFQGTVQGNIVASMGNGANSLVLDSTSMTLGNLTVTGGTGIDSVRL